MPTIHLSPLELEGRLHGQRRILALLLAEAMARGDEAFAGRLEGLCFAPDHQEDPGAVPDPAFAVEAAAAQEARLIMQQAGRLAGR
ncbi:MAG TPA: hypothetical protein GX700_19570 [Paracoccus sp.]|nr:hypothetical protein [Paracoccus sp. (in: a-proteobacteria)]